MACRGRCYNHPLKVNHGGRQGVGFGGKIYQNGIKRCGMCETSFKTRDVKCPCCGLKMRYRCRNSDGRKKLNEVAARY